MRPSVRALLALVVLATPVATATAQSVTVGASSGLFPVQIYSQPSNSFTYSWGQTFATPDISHGQLESWSFWLADNTWTGDLGLNLQLQIFEWNNGFVGGPLYSSAPVTPSDPDREQFTWNVGLNLDASKMYIAFLNPTGTYGTNQYGNDYASTNLWLACNVACGMPDDYSQGSLMYFQAQDNSGSGMYDDIHNNPFIYDYEGMYDLNFEATFTATPEPATLSLMATGIMGMAGFVRRRRRSAE